MTEFCGNLQYLRASHNMTQSQLAMLVGVSRQSVQKWEAGISYPEMDKLLKVIEVFDCTLDELVREDITSKPDPKYSIPQGIPPKDTFGYDEHMQKRARSIATGVSLIIVGSGAGLIVKAIGIVGEDERASISLLIFFVAVVAALALLVPSQIGHQTFTRQHPYVEDFYLDNQKAKMRKLKAYGIVAGIAVLFLSVVVRLLFQLLGGGQSFFTLLSWILIILGIWILMFTTLYSNRSDVERYNAKGQKKAQTKEKKSFPVNKESEEKQVIND